MHKNSFLTIKNGCGKLYSVFKMENDSYLNFVEIFGYSWAYYLCGIIMNKGYRTFVFINNPLNHVRMKKQKKNQR